MCGIGRSLPETPPRIAWLQLLARTMHAPSCPVEHHHAPRRRCLDNEGQYLVNPGVDDPYNGGSHAEVVDKRSIAPDTVVHICVRQAADTWVASCENRVKVDEFGRSVSQAFRQTIDVYPSPTVVERHRRQADRDVVAHDSGRAHGAGAMASSFRNKRVRSSWFKGSTHAPRMPNDTGVQRRTREGAKRPTRSVAATPGWTARGHAEARLEARVSGSRFADGGRRPRFAFLRGQ